jgi:UDP-MurNAc hydroxylase
VKPEAPTIPARRFTGATLAGIHNPARIFTTLGGLAAPVPSLAVRVTFIGHAGLHVETAGGTILCDPWFNPSFFGSWFPFPRNDDLDPAAIGSPDFLYVSHAHRDHLDLAWLRDHVDRSATVLLPEFGIDQLERELRQVGLRDFVRTRDRQPVDLNDSLRIAIISLAGPNIGPMGDSALLVGDPTATLINQNDAHPHEIGEIEGFERFDGHCLQHSGAIWYPMVYELEPEEAAELVETKRQRQLERALDFVDMVGATHVFPTAGPPCFLDDELFELNDFPDGPPSIFPDATYFLDALARHGHTGGHLVVPGSVAELSRDGCTVTHPSEEAVVVPFEDKRAYLGRYRDDMADAIAAERASWPTDRTDLLGTLKEWIEPLLAEAPRTRAGVGGAIGIDAGDERFLLDVPAGEVRTWGPDEAEPPFVFRIARPLLEAEVRRREPDWVNHLFLSCRFAANRDGPYNEFVYTFFKSLAPERMAYAERWYASHDSSDADIDWVVVDGWEVEPRCPHQRASLRRMGSVCGDVLTCGLHGWRFDLNTGECLDAQGVHLRVNGRVHAGDAGGPGEPPPDGW